MTAGASTLTAEQRARVDAWLDDWRVVHDHSWGQIDTAVLEVESRQGRAIVKAGGPGNHHIQREIRAHREWTRPWADTGHAAALIGADEDANVLVTSFVPGRLLEGTPAQHDADLFLQAGALLAAFHAQHRFFDPQWNDRLRDRVLRFLAMPHRISPEIEARVRAEIAQWPASGAEVVPTHGDWQPRNWLDDGGTLRVIDFGRFDFRVPEDDLVRLGRQDFAADPTLESAFIDGYGGDPRDPQMWRRLNVSEAIGTAVWAHGVGDESFEAVGHAHLASLYPR